MMADNKITALTEDTAPLTTDLVMTVDDPAGTPINKKVTIANLLRNKADAIIAVTQASHGFVAGDALYCSGANAYTKANADAAATADVVGVVAVNVGVNDFTLCTSGKMTTGVPAVAAGSVLFLSDTTAGALTTTEPTAVGHISLPIAIVTENAVSMIVYSWRGMEIGTAGSGDVIGPAGATANNLAVFDGATGKLLKDGGAPITGVWLETDVNGDLMPGSAQMSSLNRDSDIDALILGVF
jgi:hypothetical protein